ncbi:hypothetical protein EMIT053CA3_240032 [Pseudomonas donghuensis]
MLAVVYLDHYIGCAIECGITSGREQARFVISCLPVGCAQFMHIEAFAFDVPAVDYGDVPAHGLGPFQINQAT